MLELRHILILPLASQCDDWYATNGANYADITRIAEQLARSASMALLPFLDLLAAAGINKLALRATLDQENVRDNDIFHRLYINTFLRSGLL